ncbi:FAD:protein FMN transferase [Colwellia sp. UCD-KL20]|uniref:FAD:protein FMN transferase n=1 Tax=Colwellia sp. UCD-KL20 TaxID=1917165 RepID=UPI000970EEAC|nr:FAD:protein FMN transferase [Colwellia sp. UCD-KL20]
MQNDRTFTIEKDKNEYRLLFSAMASPCEVLIEIPSDSHTTEILENLVNNLACIITDEVWRIEDKYSRYDPYSVCSLINSSQGQTVSIDQETYLLLNFANVCYELSDGLFDITSGILRKVWVFNGSDNIPDKAQVEAILPLIGWNKVKFAEQTITLSTGMEIDFGGIGKEYAVDRCILLAKEITDFPLLVNLGGDLAATKPREGNKPWIIGVEHPGFENKTNMVVSLYQGALATSGNAKRFLLKDGVRYSHILNAKTGWSIINAPRSVTVSSEQCVQAGILATLSLLQGENAEAYLDEQEVKYWAVR